MAPQVITIKIAQLAKQVATARVSAGSSLEDFFKKRKLQVTSAVRVNGNVVPKTYRLRNGDIITIIGKVSGGR